MGWSVLAQPDVLPAMLPPGLTDHWFLSHFQRTGGDQVGMLQVHVSGAFAFPLTPVPFPLTQLELEKLGFSCWLDNKADDLTKQGE